MPHRARLFALTVALLLTVGAPSAFAHGFSSVVYVDATAPQRGHVQTTLGLEYDLLVVSAADTQNDDALFKTGQPAWDDGDNAAMAQALDAHSASVDGLRDQALRRQRRRQGVHGDQGRHDEDERARGRPLRLPHARLQLRGPRRVTRHPQPAVPELRGLHQEHEDDRQLRPRSPARQRQPRRQRTPRSPRISRAGSSTGSSSGSAPSTSTRASTTSCSCSR